MIPERGVEKVDIWGYLENKVHDDEGEKERINEQWDDFGR
jgi:hypothetical protein